MNFEAYSQKFKRRAEKEGLTESEILDCLNYAQPIIENNLPVIYNTSHLSKLVGVKKKYLKRASVNTNSYYRKFTIAKRNGKPREISEPLPNLKLVQSFILIEILSKVKISAFAKAYKKKSTILENTRYHLNKKKVVTLDIKDFFSSINSEKVEKIFLNLGYSPLISDFLSKLCTFKDNLPQGAPTSPYLSNIYMKDFDSKVADYCLAKDIRYTRYADDITISGNFNHQNAIEFITVLIVGLELELNSKKTKVMLPSNRQMVTGIVVNEKNQVPRKERLKLRQTIYHIKTKGLEEHKNFKNITQKNYLSHLYGKISYVVFINPNDKEFLGYKEYLKSIIK